MAIIERDIVLQGKTASGDSTIDLPITALKNIEDTADIKEAPTTKDYIPIIDSADNGQMKKTPFVAANFESIAARTVLNEASIGFKQKNLLRNQCQNSTSYGISTVVNPDGSMTLNGTNNNSKGTSILYFNMQTGAGTKNEDQYINNAKFIPSGKYILSGGSENVLIQVCISTADKSEGRIIACFGEEVQFEVTEEDQYVWARIAVIKDAVLENVTIYPMIRFAEITDSTYEPYIDDLQTQVDGLQMQIEKLSKIETLPDSVSVKNYADTLKSGRYCLFTNQSNKSEGQPPVTSHFVYDVYVYSPNTARIEAMPVSAKANTRYACIKNSGVWGDWCVFNGTQV